METIKKEPIIIEQDVFIGANSIILKGVTIGARSIIGAGSIVTKNVPADEIWGGNPAKFIRKTE
ncbi:2,3,4,5-tetrahydropyridine-2,6-dicarboxylate N-acetyltransferase [compost metagenome]